MKKLLFAILVGILVGAMINGASLFAVQGQGPDAFDVMNSTNATAMNISTSGTVYTRSFSLDKVSEIGVSYRATSVNNTPGLKIELQHSFTQESTWGADDETFVEPENMADIESNLTSETWHHQTINCGPFGFARFKITENTGSATDTQLEMKVSIIRR